MDSLNKALEEAAYCFHSGQYLAAYEKYHRLAEQGHAESQVFIGWMLFTGTGVGQDIKIASHWFHRAAALGSVRGAFYCGRYLTTQGEHKEALVWYKKAAFNGDVPATFRVGYSLVRGKGAKADFHSGLNYLKEAAKLGSVFAVREIAIQDIIGKRGVLHRVTGVLLYVYAIILGVTITYMKRDSERLIA
jgi:hypothetical protein